MGEILFLPLDFSIPYILNEQFGTYQWKSRWKMNVFIYAGNLYIS